MAEDGVKVTGIRHIVRLREMLQKWQSISLNPKARGSEKPSGIPPSINKRLKNSAHISDSEEESCPSPDHLPDIPKGYLAVYVGPELRRFIIPTSYLSLPVFKVLLEKAEEEFGFDPNGALTLPCDIETFKYILQSTKGVEYNERKQSGLEEE
ncbi:protein SMALL AUXIN UP-REGULATED RNA 54-like isoform X2 [Magnolia sinica]|uniref:protein SMALL AUXIN UP-REGULATED RNA 54-like isoform X2 n=1 Tax=Magnolia sinica TaxID=86752 RepID=UPI002658EF2F|nr:protein SMALL AUXIN UP-REGULATED RNA 54-like isoform X2 [Magnolia sinica]